MNTQHHPVEEELANLFAELGDVILELDAAGCILRCFGCKERLQAPPGALVGRGLKEVLPLEAAYPIAQAIPRAQTQAAIQTVEFIWTGEALRHFEARIAPAAEGRTLVLLRDIHQRKNAELELACQRGQLHESELRFHSMADHAPILLWMCDSEGRRTFFNQRWLRFTGRSLECELGMGWAEGVYAQDLERYMAEFLEAFVARREFTLEYRLRDAAHGYRWLHEQGAPRIAADGQFMGYIGSAIDMSDVHQAREQLRALNRRLEQRLRDNPTSESARRPARGATRART